MRNNAPIRTPKISTVPYPTSLNVSESHHRTLKEVTDAVRLLSESNHQRCSSSEILTATYPKSRCGQCLPISAYIITGSLSLMLLSCYVDQPNCCHLLLIVLFDLV